MAILKEERYAPTPNQSCTPPREGVSQQRISLTDLWSKLPSSSQQQTLIVLGRMIARQLPQATADVEAVADHGGALSLPALLGKEAGDEAR